jgi:DNA-binding transcriptional ArsR family regulator
MTRTEAQLFLFDFFLRYDSFSLKTDLASIPGALTGGKQAAVRAALAAFEEIGLVTRVSGDIEGRWVLVNSLYARDQLLVIRGETAIAIAEAVNAVLTSIADTRSLASPHAITENDLWRLVAACKGFLAREEERASQPKFSEN